ncbi:hypothetical protein [Lysobacter sp. N42]|uniref:hypothetical protein n=2 Tax=Gammaproteobacteria TaxID=1236 RepID=UPI0010D402B9|nr:hypothetical protein [Lysobacter sp. N42]TCZ91753.1 hypothetical protein EYQ95_07545 [Lysobacter sp. N42]
MVSVVVDALNEIQDDFRFVIHEVRPSERYDSLSENGCCDLMMFESLSWGWSRYPNVVAGPVLNKGTERLYGLRSRLDSGEIGFTVDGSLKVGGVLGYHYRFAGFSTARDVLELDYNVYSTDSQASLITMLTNRRIDLAVLTDEYVHWLALREHLDINGLSPNPEIDHSYTTHLILSERIAHNHARIRALFDELHHSGRLPMVYSDFGISHSYLYSPRCLENC